MENEQFVKEIENLLDVLGISEEQYMKENLLALAMLALGLGKIAQSKAMELLTDVVGLSREGAFELLDSMGLIEPVGVIIPGEDWEDSIV